MAEQATARDSEPKQSDAASEADLENGLTTQEAQERLRQYGRTA
ncbi:cation-transporting P-type ATPase [Halomonas sp.]|uniref:Cation transport ATPase-like protein n=1 Tax=Halomonas ventosae TaxID=229007 RepID=A0A4R6H4Z4_9GAMM|nr:cation transport ATPase-like protein [Halomonas ventosae]